MLSYFFFKEQRTEDIQTELKPVEMRKSHAQTPVRAHESTIGNLIKQKIDAGEKWAWLCAMILKLKCPNCTGVGSENNK